jgi:hypothetical protein
MHAAAAISIVIATAIIRPRGMGKRKNEKRETSGSQTFQQTGKKNVFQMKGQKHNFALYG